MLSMKVKYREYCFIFSIIRQIRNINFFDDGIIALKGREYFSKKTLDINVIEQKKTL